MDIDKVIAYLNDCKNRGKTYITVGAIEEWIIKEEQTLKETCDKGLHNLDFTKGLIRDYGRTYPCLNCGKWFTTMWREVTP